MRQRTKEADFFLRLIVESESAAGLALSKGDHAGYQRNLRALTVLRVRWNRAKAGYYSRKKTS